MKLFLMKICSLLVVLQGALLLAWYLGLAPVNEYVVRYYGQLLQNETIPPLVVEIVVCAVLITVGLVAFLPGGRDRSLRRSVVIKTEHGQVAVQLEALRPALMKVLRRMPEVRKVKLEINPVKGRGKAHVIAHVWLRQQASLNVSQHVDLITRHIAETTVKLLGLDHLVEIDVIVDGIKVNAKLAAREVLSDAEQLRARIAAEDVSTATAVALTGGGVAAIAATESLPAPAEIAHVEMDALELTRPLHEYEDDEVDADASVLIEDDSEEEELLDAVDPGNLPPLNMESSGGATFNSDTDDSAYALPPLSEQEIPVEVAEPEEEEAETAPVFPDAVEQEEDIEPEAPSPAEDESNVEADPFATIDETAKEVEEASEEPELEPELEPESQELPPPVQEEKKRWGFF